MKTDFLKAVRQLKQAKAAAIALGALFALLITKLVFGVGPVMAVKHAPWYALDDIDSVPVWVQTLPMMTGKVPWDISTPVNDGSVDPVEYWGVSSADARKIMQEHNILTEWWRDEVSEALRAMDVATNPVLATYPEAMGMIVHDIVQLIPDDILVDQLMEKGSPGMVHASGCEPPNQLSLSSTGIFYNIAPRRACDNVVGALVWLLFGALAALLFGFARKHL